MTSLASALGAVLPDSAVRLFETGDLAELLVLQRCCWVQEAIVNDTLAIPALHEDLDDVLGWATTWTTLVVRLNGRLVAAVRGTAQGPAWQIGRLMVAPDLQGRGLGSALLALIESLAPAGAGQFVLFTGGRSQRNIRMYERAGYTLMAAPAHAGGHIAGAVYLCKRRPESSRQ